MGIAIAQVRIERTKVYNLLLESSNSFTPPLSSEVSLDEYADKLAAHANFIVCTEGFNIIGYVAFYKNDKLKQLYIPLICVFDNYQHKGIGTKMLNRLVDDYCSEYSTIALEVVKKNTKAFDFYIKQEFKIKEDRGKRLLMIKQI